MASQIIKKFKDDLKGHPIYPFRGPLSPLLCGVCWTAKGSPQIPIIFIHKGRDTFYAIDETIYFSFSRSMFAEYVAGKVTVQELRKRYDELDGRVSVVYDETAHQNMTDLNDKELQELVKETSLYLTELIDKTLYIETLDKHIVLEVLGKEKETIVEKIWDKATHPAFHSFDERRFREVYEKLENLQKVDPVLIRKLKYIYTDYYSSKSDEEINAILVDVLKQGEKNIERLKKSEESFAKSFNEYTAWQKTLSMEEKELVDYIQFVMEARDIRKDPIAKAQVIIERAAHELARRAGISEEDFRSYVPDEYCHGAEYLKKLAGEIQKRKQGVIGMLTQDGIETETGDFDALLKEFDEVVVGKHADQTELKGQIANKGKAKGVVRIVLDPRDDKGFQNGDILVTSMTRPEFVPLMKRAGAVVTNEGGITCHAAIVSRELNIPCIIGTKMATKVLKDGDMVEVDADKGIVSIIK